MRSSKIYPHFLSGPSLKVKLVSTETFPLGVVLEHFSDDVAATPRDIRLHGETILHVNGESVEVASRHGVYCAIRVPTGSRESHNLSVLLELSERRMSGPESLHSFVEYACGATYAFSGGVILRSKSLTDQTFFFHFSHVRAIERDVFAAMRGDAEALASRYELAALERHAARRSLGLSAEAK